LSKPKTKLTEQQDEETDSKYQPTTSRLQHHKNLEVTTDRSLRPFVESIGKNPLLVYLRKPVPYFHISIDKEKHKLIFECSWDGSTWSDLQDIAKAVELKSLTFVLPPDLQKELEANPNPSHTLEFSVTIPKQYELAKTTKFETDCFIGAAIPYEEQIQHLI